MPEDCRHFNPPGHFTKSVYRNMSDLAIAERRYDIKWGVVNSGNALCAAIFHTKWEAVAWRKANASAYRVVEVVITPIYTTEAG